MGHRNIQHGSFVLLSSYLEAKRLSCWQQAGLKRNCVLFDFPRYLR